MKPQQLPIAIIGLAGTFAQAKNLEEYWGNILDEVDCISDVPDTHWSVDEYYDPDPKAPDKTYCKRGGFIPDIEFNPMEFGLPPNILEHTDVSQLLSLVIAKQALVDAGYGITNPHAKNTGVSLGVSSLKQITPLVSRLQYPIWKRVLQNSGVPDATIEKIIEKIKLAYIPWQEDSFPGYLSNVVAGRISNRLDLGGINCSVDAACASSMAALQLAMHELNSHNCDMMIAGGVDTNNTIMAYLSFSKTPAFTQSDHMSPFDIESDGMLIGEGVGMLVLKRLEDAERDGDRVYAVVKGIGASSDGKYKSIYAPRMEGQELALQRAYENANCAPCSVGLIEAHGTGTATGDPTEFAAINKFFSAGGAQKRHIALGSVKSQIGHTKVAAGAASLIKAALALHYKILPPTINITQPNPALGIDDSPFYLNTRTRPWFSAVPRRAGVSSFGFGGTNFHVILEEYSAQTLKYRRLSASPYAVFVQSSNGDAMVAACEQRIRELKSSNGESCFHSWVLSSKNDTIPAEAARMGFVVSTLEEAVSLLEMAIESLSKNPDVNEFTHPRGIYYRKHGVDSRGKLVALFSGQGAQYLEMGKSLCLNFPHIRQTYADMDALLLKQGLPPISDVVFPPPVFEESARNEQSLTLQFTHHAQPAIGAFSLGLYKLLQQAGFVPNFVAGHSLGELTALCAAGVISEPDYMSLLIARGQAMGQPPESGIDAGAMLAVSGDVDALERFMARHPGVSIANINSRTQLVLAGSRGELKTLKSEWVAAGNRATMLPVSGAFHSHRVAHAQAPFARELERITFSQAQIPVFSNSTGKAYPDTAAEMRQLVASHIVSPVNFRQEIETIHDHGGRIFIEFGPGNILTGLVNNTLAGKPFISIALNPNKNKDSDTQLREAYVELRVAGLNLADLDPHQPMPEVTTVKSGLTVKLNGNPYVSEKTKAAFESALKQGATVSPTGNFPLSKLEHETMKPEHPLNQSLNKSVLEQKSKRTGESGSDVHQQYLENTADYADKYFNLMQQLYSLINNVNCRPDTLAIFERGMGHFHDQQIMAQQVHEQYLKNQVEYSQSLLQTQSQPSMLHGATIRYPAISAEPPMDATFSKQPHPDALPEAIALSVDMPSVSSSEKHAPYSVKPELPMHKATEIGNPVEVEIASASEAGADKIAAIMMAVISEKTGYPQDTLDATMDLDADLGIDSIKRVEIMASLEGKLQGTMAGLNFEKFAELRTIGQIANYLASAEKKTLTQV